MSLSEVYAPAASGMGSIALVTSASEARTSFRVAVRRDMHAEQSSRELSWRAIFMNLKNLIHSIHE